MQKYTYSDSLNVSKIKKLYFALLSKFAKICIFPTCRLSIYKLMGVNIGNNVSITPYMDIVDYSLGKFLTLEDRCTITDTTFLISSGPNNSKLIKYYPRIYGPITVEEDAWIGTKSVIFPGVTIGKCSVVGAGSIVTKDIPPYSVAVGNPARVIKTIDKSKL
ncbi:MAG: acyltransferase [bacterium]